MQNPKINLIINIIASVLTQTSTILINIMLTPLLILRLGQETFGIYASVISFSWFCFVICDLGLSLSLIKKTSADRLDCNKLGEYLTQSLIIKSPLLLLSLFAYSFFFSEYSFFQLVFPFWLFTIGMAIQPTWFFQGIEDLKLSTAINVIGKALVLIFVYYGVNSSDDFSIVAYTTALSNILVTILCFALIKSKGYSITKTNLKNVLNTTETTLSYFYPLALVAVYMQATVFIIGKTMGPKEAAIYAVADQFFRLGRMIVSSITQAFYPYMVFRKDLRFLLLSTSTFFILAVFSATILWNAVPLVVMWYVGDGFQNSIELIRIFMITCVVLVPSAFIGFPLLDGFGQHKLANRTLLYGSTVFLIGVLYYFIFDEITAIKLAYLAMITEIVILVLRACAAVWLIKKVDNYGFKR